MLAVKCKNCGKRYDYKEHGCCPECGAYNRLPRRDRVNADGTIHHMSDADFLENSDKRRRSQGGKVCFEQDVCYEDQARKKHGKADVHIDKIAARIEGAMKRRTKTVKKSGKSAAIIAVLVALLPVLVRVCTVVFEKTSDFVISQELPTDVTDYNDFGDVVTQNVAMNDLFFWWGEDAIITEFEVRDNGNQKEAVITAYRLTDTDQPLLYYSQRGVEWMDMMTYDYVTDLGSNNYSYHYFLPEDTVVEETEFMALCCGYEGDTYIETEIWLTPQ